MSVNTYKIADRIPQPRYEHKDEHSIISIPESMRPEGDERCIMMLRRSAYAGYRSDWEGRQLTYDRKVDYCGGDVRGYSTCLATANDY